MFSCLVSAPVVRATRAVATRVTALRLVAARDVSARALIAASCVAAFGMVASSANAQSAQKYALQVAALSTSISVGSGSSTINGYGIEPQLRFNRLYVTESFGVSLGLGAQYTSHTRGSQTLKIAGVFIEPRWVPVLGSTTFFPYLAGRLALLQQSSDFASSSTGAAYGAGAGVAIKLTPRLNLDAGVALVRQQFGDASFSGTSGGSAQFKPFTSYAAKVGVSWGFPVKARP